MTVNALSPRWPPPLQIFAPGVISATGNVDALTFAPDGNTAWFDEAAGGGSTSMDYRQPDGRTLYVDCTATFAVAYPRTRARTQEDLARARLWDNGNGHLWSFSLAPWLDARPSSR